MKIIPVIMIALLLVSLVPIARANNDEENQEKNPGDKFVDWLIKIGTGIWDTTKDVLDKTNDIWDKTKRINIWEYATNMVTNTRETIRKSFNDNNNQGNAPLPPLPPGPSQYTDTVGSPIFDQPKNDAFPPSTILLDIPGTLEEGVNAYNKGEYFDALTYVDSVLAIEESNRDALTLRGDTLSQFDYKYSFKEFSDTAALEGAIDNYNKAIKDCPECYNDVIYKRRNDVKKRLEQIKNPDYEETDETKIQNSICELEIENSALSSTEICAKYPVGTTNFNICNNYVYTRKGEVSAHLHRQKRSLPPNLYNR